MTRPTRTLGRLGLAAVAVFAVLAFAGACEMPLPLASDDRPEPEQAAVATESAEGAPTAEATTTETAESPEIDATEVPEPPVERSVGVEEGPTFTPFTTAPAILNRSELVQAMEENYPPLLKDAGIGGTIRIYMFVDESGQVRDTRIDESSGHPALDDAALRVAGTYRFSPALKDDAPVAVWIAMPVTFQVR